MSGLRVAFLAVLLQGVTVSSGSIEGVVVAAGTREPVAGAEVVLGRAPILRVPPTVKADNQGRFIFRNVPTGDYSIGARDPGGIDLPGKPTAVSVAAGQQIQDVRVEMIPGGVVEGRILDRNGEPAKDVTVIVFQPSFYEGRPIVNASFRRELGRQRITQTDREGTYRVASLYPGMYYVAARLKRPHSRFLRDTCLPAELAEGVTDGFPAGISGIILGQIARERPSLDSIPDVVYFPSTPSAAMAEAIHVTARSASRADFELVAAPKPLRLRGEVVDAAGNRIRRASVTLLPGGGVLHDTSHGLARFCNVAAGKGTFEITNVFEGNYTLLANGDVDGNALAGTASVKLADDIKDIRIVVHSRPAISGSITFERFPDQVDFSRLAVQLVPEFPTQLPVGDASNIQHELFSTTPDNDGAFSLSGILPGRYRLLISRLPFGTYLRSARLGQTDVLADGLDLSSSSNQKLEIVVAGNGGTLDISLKNSNDEPAVYLTVALVPDATNANRHDLYRTGSSDNFGQLLIEGIAPGSYRLFVWDRVPDGAWLNADFLRLDGDRARSIEVSEGTTQTIEITQ